LNLFKEEGSRKAKAATDAMDKINKSLGKDLVRFGIQGFTRSFKARAAFLSPSFTTNLKDIIIIKN